MKPEIAIIGGSGLYSMFQGGDATTVRAQTDHGPPSAPIEVAHVGSRPVAFLARHGAHHEFPPHAIPYRANVAALRDLGVRQIVAPCAVGSFRTDLTPGTLVVPDQLVDQTRGRSQTIHDRFGGGTFHARFAEPYCDRMRRSVLAAAAAQGWPAHDGGDLVVIDGPRFSTRAEATWYAAQGWSLVNMTGHPEAVLARELGMCYVSVALVTDHAANLRTGAGVSEEEVYETFARHTARLRDVLLETVSSLAPGDGCRCCE